MADAASPLTKKALMMGASNLVEQNAAESDTTPLVGIGNQGIPCAVPLLTKAYRGDGADFK